MMIRDSGLLFLGHPLSVSFFQNLPVTSWPCDELAAFPLDLTESTTQVQDCGDARSRLTWNPRVWNWRCSTRDSSDCDYCDFRFRWASTRKWRTVARNRSSTSRSRWWWSDGLQRRQICRVCTAL